MLVNNVQGPCVDLFVWYRRVCAHHHLACAGAGACMRAHARAHVNGSMQAHAHSVQTMKTRKMNAE